MTEAKTAPVIEVKNLSKKYFLPGAPKSRKSGGAGKEFITVLRGLTFNIAPGSWTSLTGPSGSGKSTLLGLLAGLDQPDEGSIVIDGIDLTPLGEDQRAAFRARRMGFIFQSFRLLPTLTALENVAVPLEILGRHDSHGEAARWLERVGLSHRLTHTPSELSGGEQQRVAIARAFVTQPRLLFADEPTGNLDSKNGALILQLLRELTREQQSTLVVVTHDPAVAEYGTHQLRLRDGEMVGA